MVKCRDAFICGRVYRTRLTTQKWKKRRTSRRRLVSGFGSKPFRYIAGRVSVVRGRYVIVPFQHPRSWAQQSFQVNESAPNFEKALRIIKGVILFFDVFDSSYNLVINI